MRLSFATREQYSKVSKLIKKSVKNGDEKWVAGIAKKLQDAANSGNQRGKKKKNPSSTVRDKNGNLIMSGKSTLNPPALEHSSLPPAESVIDDFFLDLPMYPPTRQEIRPFPELRCGSDASLDLLTPQFKKVWYLKEVP